jgi:phosphoribosyl 1,2-cyclic phosphodiesterase
LKIKAQKKHLQNHFPKKISCYFARSMALFTTSLNSGSNGNCYYIGNDKEAILVDAGLSCRETEKRMKLLGLDMQKVKAIFISHEHTDHIKGVAALAEKYQLPVYTTEKTPRHGGLHFSKHLLLNIASFQPIEIGGLSIIAFPKFHDAADPHSFIIQYNNITIGVFTDIGRPCDQLIAHFKQCNAAYLEANYDEEMLQNGRYPYHLKARIRGGSGHLSNKEALEVFVQHRPSFMTHLFLAHLSRDNNDPNLAQKMFQQHAGETEIIIASRNEATAIYAIQSKKIIQQKLVSAWRPAAQMSLF